MSSGPRPPHMTGLYRWLIPAALGLLLLLLFAIVVAVLAAAFGIWPGA